MVNAKMIMGLTVAALVIIVLFAVTPMIGSTIDDTSNIQDNVAATGTLTFGTGPGVVTENINLSTETYTLIAAYSAPFDVIVGDGAAATLSAALTTEINANSTLFSAVDGTGSVVVTALTSGTDGNAYASTTNITDASFGSTTLTGGIDGSDWHHNVNADLDSPAQSWTTFLGLIILAFLAVIIAIVIVAFKDMSE